MTALLDGQAGVDDAMVERSASAAFVEDSGQRWSKATTREREFYMRIARAALQAALGGGGRG